MAWYNYKKYDFPDHEKFKLYRIMTFGNGVKGRKKCAAYLYVQDRTVQAWEVKENKILYATFKLLRMKATGRLMDSPELEGFHVQSGTIYNNANQDMQIARRAIEDYKTIKFIRSISQEESDLMKRLRVRYRQGKNNRSENYKKHKSKEFY